MKYNTLRQLETKAEKISSEYKAYKKLLELIDKHFSHEFRLTINEKHFLNCGSLSKKGGAYIKPIIENLENDIKKLFDTNRVRIGVSLYKYNVMRIKIFNADNSIFTKIMDSFYLYISKVTEKNEIHDIVYYTFDEDLLSKSKIMQQYKKLDKAIKILNETNYTIRESIKNEFR
jgi:hypothetical protein